MESRAKHKIVQSDKKMKKKVRSRSRRNFSATWEIRQGYIKSEISDPINLHLWYKFLLKLNYWNYLHNDFQAIGVVGTIPVVWYVLCHEEVLYHGERQPKSKSTWRIVKVTHRVKMIWTHSESMNKGHLYYATTICLLHAFWFSHKLVSFYVCIT